MKIKINFSIIEEYDESDIKNQIHQDYDNEDGEFRGDHIERFIQDYLDNIESGEVELTDILYENDGGRKEDIKITIEIVD